jgi:hypothetical protein
MIVFGEIIVHCAAIIQLLWELILLSFIIGIMNC